MSGLNRTRRKHAAQSRADTGRKFRKLFALVAVAVTGTATAALATTAGKSQDQGEPAPLSAFVHIEDVKPNVQPPPVRQDGSTGMFTVDCGTNGNRKLSPDNPVAQPGVKNGAQHVHDFVGNLSISAESTDGSLQDSDTTCNNGDKSSYFWPVVRINKQANTVGANADTLKAAGTPSINCPTIADRLPAVPDQARDEVNQNLRQLDTQIRDATERLTHEQNQRDPNFINNVILNPLRGNRVVTIDRIATAISRNAARPTGLEQLAPCTLNNANANGGSKDSSASATTLPGAEGPNLEVAGNVGGIVQPAGVTIEYRGNATGKVVPMPKLLKMITGAAKPTSRGPANARASWTCSGFTDRLSDKYVICPAGSQVMRVHDFPVAGTGATPTATTTGRTSASRTRPQARAPPAPRPCHSYGSPSRTRSRTMSSRRPNTSLPGSRG
jgi:hypothetical protein